MTFYLATWFPREYRTRIIAWFMIAIPASSLIGGPLCGLLLQLDGVLGSAGWKWMFIAVSLPPIALGFVVLRCSPTGPKTPPGCRPKKRAPFTRCVLRKRRIAREPACLGALGDVRIMTLALVQFGFTLGSYGIGIWLPLIIKDYRLSNLAIGFLAAIPYLFATAGMLLWAHHVDRSGRKIVNMTLALALASGALVAYVFSGSLLFSLTCLTLALIGVTSARGIFWAIPPRILSGAGAAGGLAFINSVGTFGGFAGPYLMGVLKDATGAFVTGILVMAAIMAATTILSASMKLMVPNE